MGENDNDAWQSLRAVVRDGIGRWVKSVWQGTSYVTREADEGYAPIPTPQSLKKLEPYPKLIAAAFGPHGIIRDLNHRGYRAYVGKAPLPDTAEGDSRDPLC
jgi:hypothetical protein